MLPSIKAHVSAPHWQYYQLKQTIDETPCELNITLDQTLIKLYSTA